MKCGAHPRLGRKGKKSTSASTGSVIQSRQNNVRRKTSHGLQKKKKKVRGRWHGIRTSRKGRKHVKMIRTCGTQVRGGNHGDHGEK